MGSTLRKTTINPLSAPTHGVLSGTRGGFVLARKEDVLPMSRGINPAYFVAQLVNAVLCLCTGTCFLLQILSEKHW